VAKANLQKRVLRYFDKGNWQENFTGIILSAVIIVVIGLLLYNYFGRQQNQENEAVNVEKTTESQNGTGFGSLALPATYKVATGDSLVKISEKYYKNSDFWPGLAKVNKLEKPSSIEPGTEINVPKTEEVSNITVSDLAPKNQGPITGSSYVVQYGDTLSSIAQRAYGDWSQWQKVDQVNHLGRLPNGNPLIHSGNVLVIPR
jgi:nucleoid-associated protein YgaU